MKRRLSHCGETATLEEQLADAVTPLWRLNYEKQLWLKHKRQEDIMRRICRALAHPSPPMQPIRPSPVTDGYRNKSTFSVNVGEGGDPKTVGFYVGTGKGHNIVCVRGDYLKNMPEKHKLVARCYEEFLRSSPLEPCLLFHMGGHWREITVRTNAAGKTMAIVFFHPQMMVPGEVQLHKEALLDFFTQGPGAVCQLDSLYFQESTMTRCSHQQAPYQLLYGASHIHEELMGLKFRISPDAFFQVNTAGAEVLFNGIRELSALGEMGGAVEEPSDVGRVSGSSDKVRVGGAVRDLSGISEVASRDSTLLDVCCGAGTIGISMANAVDRVIGVEIVEQAVEDARYNASLNQVRNCQFLSGKAEEVLPRLLPSLGSNLVIVANPSRAGLHYRSVRALRNLPSIRRLVYVSCKPEGEATRNFLELCCPADPRKKLTGEPFTVTATVPVDMFPHTMHSYNVRISFEMIETMVTRTACPNSAERNNVKEETTGVSSLSSSEDVFDDTYKEREGPKPPRQIVWRNVVLMTFLHIGALYGFTLLLSTSVLTLAWSMVCFMISALGVTAGAHRLWSHRSYKASLPLRIFLAIANSMAFQNDVYEWARDHRVHHKYSETDADPHNAVRGFFFAHIGWLLVRKHPDVIEKGRKLELADLKADKVVMFQRKYYKPSVLLMCFGIPMLVPWYFWGESLWVAYFVPGLLRYTIVLNATWLVNSAAHMWGNRPYDETINPRENKFVAFSAIGEGFHNFHHTFPFDYATSEFGCKVNLTTCFIDLMCYLGLASNRKKVSQDAVKARVQRTGDGSHHSG
ncbi:hypothetical protein GJAV_G00241860 [Gymnothorax javanicus]|nr:hypothetical protein GJAV_G00241860 [Gymnothorax javanicus]